MSGSPFLYRSGRSALHVTNVTPACDRHRIGLSSGKRAAANVVPHYYNTNSGALEKRSDLSTEIR
jgi:hypothetical protein